MSRINVCLSFDDNYAKYAGVTIASILANAKDSDELYFYLLDGGVTTENKEKILSLRTIKDCTIKFVPIDEDLFNDYKKIKTHKYITLPTYYRLKISELIPDVERIIYLDCDVVANVSLEELFNADMGDCAVAGVRDVEPKWAKDNSTYVNAGILLLDLKKFKERNIEQAFLDYTKDHIETIKMGDQEIINEVLKNRIKLLEPKWNVQASHFIARSIYTEFPWLIHYIGVWKPWHDNSFCYYNDLYFMYQSLTPWGMPKESLKAFLKKKNLISSWIFFKRYPLFPVKKGFARAFYETYIYKRPKVTPNTFFLWEPCSRNHSEVLPGFAKYLLDLGYDVSVLVIPDRLKEGLFSRFQHERLFLNKLSQKEIKKFFKTDNLFGAKGVIVTTVGKINSTPDYKDAHGFFKLQDGQKALFVEHEIKPAVDNGTFDEKFITLRKMDYKNAKSVVVNPHYFGDVKITPKNNDTVNFITIGALRAKRKDSHLIIDAVKCLHDKGITNFKVTVIGKGTLNHLPREIRKYFDIKGRLDFSEMYDEIEKADFFLTAYNPQNEAHRRYITTGTSGSFQLMYGFGKPCVIVKDFASINGFDNSNSLLYEGIEQYADAMQRGIQMSESEYKIMQNNLLAYSKQLYDESLNNLKELIND